MAMTNEQLTKWIDEIFGTIDEIKTNSGDITTLTKTVKQQGQAIQGLQSDVSDLEDQTAGTVSLPKAALQHFTDGSATQALDLVADIIPVQAGTGDPSPTNVRAISGYSSVTATAAGVNILNTTGTNTDNGYVADKYLSNVDLEVSGFTGFITEYTKVKASENYITINGLSGTNPAICFYDENKQFLSGTKYNNTFPLKIAIPQNAVYFRASVANDDLLTAIINYGETATTYEPYSANTATLSLGRTIYGGSANFTTGAEQETMDAIDLGDLTWQKATWAETAVFISSAVSDFAAPAEGSTPVAICEKYKPVSRNTLYYDGSVDNAFCISSGKNIVIRDSVLGAGDAAAFKTAVTGVKLVAELATPNAYTTTPAQLPLLQGENNVSATSGPITLTYAPDNVLAEVYAYIQKRFDTLTASLAANRTTRKTTKTLTKKED